MIIKLFLILLGVFILQSCNTASNKQANSGMDDFAVKQIGVKNQYPVSPERFKPLIKIDNCQSLVSGDVEGGTLNQKPQSKLAEVSEVVVSQQDIADYKASLKLKAKMIFKSKDKQKFANGVIDGLSYTPAAVVKHKTQPEVKMTYEQYKAKILTESKKQEAASFLKQNLQTLLQIEQKYGVDKEVLVALFTMESGLGKVKGKHIISDALFSLALQSKRRDFFENELLTLIKLIYYNVGLDQNLQGSWAGAFGFVQFMPSTFLKFAVDFDGDGFIDLFAPKDALASAANYLMSIGWQFKKPIAKSISIDSKNICLAGDKIKDDLFSDAYLIAVDKDLSINTKLGLVAYSNYFALLDWNRSLYFATSVAELSQFLANAS